jgi:hypothetical protein
MQSSSVFNKPIWPTMNHACHSRYSGPTSEEAYMFCPTLLAPAEMVIRALRIFMEVVYVFVISALWTSLHSKWCHVLAWNPRLPPRISHCRPVGFITCLSWCHNMDSGVEREVVHSWRMTPAGIWLSSYTSTNHAEVQGVFLQTSVSPD